MTSTVLTKNFRVLVLLLVATASFAQERYPYTTCSKNFNPHVYNPARTALLESTDITYIAFRFAVDPAVKYIDGNILYHFKAPYDNYRSITFELTDSLSVDSVIYHNKKINYYHYNRQLICPFDTVSLAKGIADSIRVYYHGVPPTTGFGSFTKDYHNGSPVLWTLSEPNGASDWWPCIQLFTDKIDSTDTYITVPNNNIAVSNGVLISETTISSSKKEFHWKHRYPIAFYLPAIAVTNFSHYTDSCIVGADRLFIHNYVYPESVNEAKELLSVTSDFIKFFTEKIGDYPFKKEQYGHAQFNRSGGMEHQTMSFVGNFEFDLIAHELAHQWFGNKVTCSGWDEIWLNESFATFLTLIAIEKFRGDSDFIDVKSSFINAIVAQPGGSVISADTVQWQAIFDSRLRYKKGAMVLNMLRLIIGDNAFYAGLRDYLNHSTSAYGFGTTALLTSSIQNHTSYDVATYFDKWIYKEGFPEYSLSWEQHKDNSIDINLRQFTSHVSVSNFELPVMLRFSNKDSVYTTTIFPNSTDYSERINLNFKAEEVLFDPEKNIVGTVKYIKKNPQLNPFIVYPIPSSAEWNIEINETGNYISQITIYNHIGQLTDELIFDGYFTKEIIPTSTYGKGLYTLIVTTTNGTVYRKVVGKI